MNDRVTFRGSPPQTYTLNIRLALKASAEAKPTVRRPCSRATTTLLHGMPLTLAPHHTPRAARLARRLGRALLPVSMLLVASAAQTQPQTKGCPRFARVPGYGACTNTGGSNCGFCTYRCNDDTVVRWNVCGT